MQSGRHLTRRPCLRGRRRFVTAGGCGSRPIHQRFGSVLRGDSGQCDAIPRVVNGRRFHPIAAAWHPASTENAARARRRSDDRLFGSGGANANDDASRRSSATATTRVLLPKLGQNGTLVLRSDSDSLARVRIVSRWRDDSLLELLPVSSAVDDDDDAAPASEGDRETIASFDENAPETSLGRLRLTNREGGTTTSLGRRGAMVEVDISSPSKGSQESVEVVATVPEKSNVTCVIRRGDIEVVGKLEGDARFATTRGSIAVDKLRGHDVTLTTANSGDCGGDAASNDGETTTSSGAIHVRKAVEAKTVRIDARTRVRARMLNGSDVSVSVGLSEIRGFAKGEFDKLDEDDEGAVIDVGSLYVSGGGGGAAGASDNEARLIVDASCGDIDDSGGDAYDERGSGLVRVKSSHGHVTVHARTDRANHTNERGRRRSSPLIDLGGVNGSCDVTLESISSCSDEDRATFSSDEDDVAAVRVHFDSLTPESVSAITSRGRAGRTSVTMDRKAEADVRLLSVANSGTVLPSHVDAYSLASDDAGDVRSALLEVDDRLRKRTRKSSRVVEEDAAADEQGRSISIETDAFAGEWGPDALDSGRRDDDGDDRRERPWPAIEYAQGTMRNRSGEPDSRFDRSLRGGSRGKINLDGAASQALHGFRGRGQKAEGGDDSSPSASGPSSDTSSPLLAVAVDGTIRLETLSWFGSIARRYSLEEGEEERRKDGRGVGRTASRSPRLGD